MGMGGKVLLGLFSCVLAFTQAQESFCTLNGIKCYSDSDTRTLTYAAAMDDYSMTVEKCANMCFAKNFALGGVEDAIQCFCGNELNPAANATVLPNSRCNNPCAGNSSETCGGSYALNIGTISCSQTQPPNYQSCLDSRNINLPFCNHTLPIEDRVKDLISRMTLTQKITMITPQPELGNICEAHTGGIDALGLSPYSWLVETNTGIASSCLTETECSTTFSGPMGMGASFNRTSWRLKGSVFGTEMRAFANAHGTRGSGTPIGLTGYGPNINIARDPRFGRSSELPGEDPLLSGLYAANMVAGMQEEDQNGHPKMIAMLKHFTAYSRETNRGHDTYNISMHDLWETYLAQYEIAFLQGNASGVMCSYNAVNGKPSCAHGYILNDVIRGKWSPDALVTTDCGAVSNLLGDPVNAKDEPTAAAFALNNGTDIEMGSTVMTYSLATAIERNLTTEAAVDAAVRRAFLPLFRAGRFDPVSTIEWFKYNETDIGSPLHRTIQFEAALQSLVLLKNQPPQQQSQPAQTANKPHDKHQNVDHHTHLFHTEPITKPNTNENTRIRNVKGSPLLPLAAGRTKVAVIGPQASAQEGLLSDYFGDFVCFDKTFDCIPTIAGEIARVNGESLTVTAKGVDMNSQDASGIQAALDLVPFVDVVVLAIGIDKSIEFEGQDRTDTALPGLQQPFAELILSMGKPVVIVLTNGGQLAIDTLIGKADAIVEAFNPSLAGARAIAETLFGMHNRWGKLPVTMYPHEYIQQQSMTNYDMSLYPGRTYRYYVGTPLFPFGFGLSYASFTHTCTQKSAFAALSNSVAFDCSVTNTANVDGDEVVMVFHSAGDDVRKQAKHPVPIKALVDFERVFVPAGSSTNLSFSLDMARVLALVNEDGDKVVYSGTHKLLFSRGVGDDVEIDVVVPSRMSLRIPVPAPQSGSWMN